MNESIQILTNRARPLPFQSKVSSPKPASRPSKLISFRLIRLTGVMAMAGWIGILCGCSKEEKVAVPTPADIKPVNPNDSEKAQEQTRVQQLVAHNKGIQAPPAALKLRGGEPATPEVLEAYNQELTRVRFKMGESPESLQELKTKWIQGRRLLPPLPTPPPGKRIVYDPLRIIIRLDPP